MKNDAFKKSAFRLSINDTGLTASVQVVVARTVRAATAMGASRAEEDRLV